VSSALIAGTYANGASQSIGTTTHLTTDAAVTIAVSGNNEITITAHASAITAGAEFVVSDVVLSRGINAPTTATDITSRALATDALAILDRAVEGINSTRATLGASMSRLEYASDNLQNVSQNSSAARGRVLDADYASETTELARTQIIQQASTAMLSQANQAQQSVLSLLK
jgi:flagellin